MFGKTKKQAGSNEPPPPILRCSFCNKTRRQVKKLIAGPNVQICDECVDICLYILSEERKDVARSVAVEGHVEPAGRGWPASALIRCGLCGMATTLEESLAVPERGIICAGCVGAFEAALAERNAPS